MRKTTGSYIGFLLALLYLGLIFPFDRAISAENGPAARARLAIIPLRADLETSADLLAAGLSTRKNVELVERQQIKKVLNELALANTQAQSRLKLGEILAADGLLFLDRLSKGGTEFLSVKLVAVKPGVVINRSEVPWPITEPDKWAVFAAEQQAALLPKLFVRKEDAIPVSLLSLRSSVITQDTMALDRQLADLLARSLSSQPKIFVLERQRLDRLAYEKDWQATNESFWNGAMVIEGVVNPETVTAGVVKIKARLSPGKGQPLEVVVEGKRQQLADLISQLTTKVMEILQTSAETSSWNPQAEALQYFEEARWQMRWGFASEAQQAAESAWALGLRTPEAVALRVEAYSRFLIGSFNSWSNGVPSSKVTAEHVYYCRRALENYLELNRSSETNALPAAWPNQGQELLRLASMHLDHVNQAGKRDGINRDDLRPTREKLRDLVKLVEQTNPVMEAAKLNNGELPGYPPYAVILMNYGGLWEETYAAGLKHFERGVRAGYYLPLVSRQPAGVRCDMCRTSWSNENLLDCEDQWTAMLARLQQDPDKLVRLSAYVMELKSFESDYQFDDVFLRAWQFLKANQDALAKGELPAEVARWLADPRSVVHYRTISAPLGRKKLVPEYKKELDQWMINIKLAREEAKFASILRRLERFTNEKLAFGSNEFLPLGIPLDLERADRLMAAVQAYESVVNTNRLSTSYLRSQIGAVYRTAGKTLPPPPPMTPPAASKKAVPTGPPPRPVMAGPTPEPFLLRTPEISEIPRAPRQISQTNSATVNLPAAVTVATPLPKGTELRYRGWKQWKLMGGRLWVETWANVAESYSTVNSAGIRNHTERSLVEVTLSPTETQTVHYAEKDRKDIFGSDSTSWNMRRGEPLAGDKANFVLHRNQLYRLAEGKLWQETATRSWLPINLDLPDSTRLAVVHDRLLANTSESLLEVEPATGKINILASLRNKPARTLLDNLPDLAQADLFAGPQGAIRAAIEDGIYQLPANSQDWQRITDLGANIRYRRVARDGLLYEEGSIRTQNGFYALLPADGKVTGLLPPAPPQFGRRSTTGSWLWAADDLMPEHTGRTVILDGRDLWVLEGPGLLPSSASKSADESYQLKRYMPGISNALKFTFKFPADFAAGKSIHDTKPELDLLVDDKYLVLVAPSESKAFILPKATLNNLTAQQQTILGEDRKARRGYLEKRKQIWHKMYDRNQNGKLDPDENEAMLKNKEAQKNLQELKDLNELNR
ncbi:MAG: hypothetical protein ACO1QS_18825 [Verrucomicrobiota bacterium]